MKCFLHNSVYYDLRIRIVVCHYPKSLLYLPRERVLLYEVSHVACHVSTVALGGHLEPALDRVFGPSLQALLHT